MENGFMNTRLKTPRTNHTQCQVNVSHAPIIYFAFLMHVYTVQWFWFAILNILKRLSTPLLQVITKPVKKELLRRLSPSWNRWYI